MLKPAARREVVGYLKQAFGMSERRACGVAAICRATHRYRAHRRELPELRAALVGLARDKPKYGYRFLHRMLRRRGFALNHKRVYRITARRSSPCVATVGDDATPQLRDSRSRGP